MGTDIHWAIERRDTEGRWWLVACEDRSWALGSARNVPHDDPSRATEREIDFRDYDLFPALSGVMGAVESPLAIPDVPKDAAKTTIALAEAPETHSAGWVDGHGLDSVAGFPSLDMKEGSEEQARQHALEQWCGSVLHFLHEGHADEILPPHRNDRHRLCYPDDWSDLGDGATETNHEKLERIKASKKLIDWRADPSAVRIVVWYDR
ncbi:hypothetical protein WV31_10740 [Magnetospirillum sp. ME-1]|uniref:hypothetical protein n=1 Tax=Magnetospirillum sp. ME-1 TaxID=1639348 RepID=UPI000A17AB8B|nr:hypothetical protein [Magnetospirillum sp. ME-1]ARJ66104.1 hypothetical protein WV31_10740 [Magnetospirillum sp. ME-1]